ncbi:MAG: cation diffusion facilitator family transporter [Ignavibacteriales bacterium]|nr:cation diffusion facilitator family transporter [Ignavibacteriales bacterium]
MTHNHTHTIYNQNINSAFMIGIVLNMLYIIIEVIFGLSVNSMALLADAGHNFADILGLIIAWGGSYLSALPVTKTRTYGFRKSTILAALFNSIILMIALGVIFIESIHKIGSPQPISGITMMIVAGIGVVINTVTAMLFFNGRKNDLNIKGAFLHMASDAVVSLGVVVAGLLINITGIFLFDPIISLIIVVVITISTWGLLKDSLHLSIDAVPANIDYQQVYTYLSELSGVGDVHDLHIWAMSTTEYALTVHLVIPSGHVEDQFLNRVASELFHDFGIHHSTIQIESNTSNNTCRDDQI